MKSTHSFGTCLTPLIAAVIFASGVNAQNAPADAGKPPARAASGQEAAVMTDGEVRKIDREAGKLTLRHGPIASLDMPAMTMVFRVSDQKMLESVKEGDKVRFLAARIDGAITLTKLEPAR
jgi:Cu(I)/Ag(I) efflux system periplasmic protein CusF